MTVQTQKKTDTQQTCSAQWRRSRLSLVAISILLFVSTAQISLGADPTCSNDFKGTCKNQCDGGIEDDKGQTRDCPASTPVCCVPNGGGGGTCANLKGTCKNQCDKATEDDKGQTSDCSASTPVCCVPKGGGGGGGGGTPVTITFPNPLSITTVDQFLTVLMDTLKNIIVALALLALVFAGVMYIASGAYPKLKEKAKDAFGYALTGFAIAIAAPIFLKEIYTILGGTPPSAIGSAPGALDIINRALEFLLGIAGALAVGMLVIAGITYMGAGANKGLKDTAKNMTTWALIGTAVALGSLLMLKQVALFLE